MAVIGNICSHSLLYCERDELSHFFLKSQVTSIKFQVPKKYNLVVLGTCGLEFGTCDLFVDALIYPKHSIVTQSIVKRPVNSNFNTPVRSRIVRSKVVSAHES